MLLEAARRSLYLRTGSAKDRRLERVVAERATERDGRWDIGTCGDVLDEERLTELYDTRMEAVDWRSTRLFIPSGDVAAQ